MGFFSIILLLNSRGVCILFNNGFKFRIIREGKKDYDGNMLAFDLVIDEHKITLININDQTLILLVFMKKFERLFLQLIILLCSLWGFKLKATIYTLIIYM